MMGKDSMFVDSWGSGPFLITVAGKRYCFEDSDRFGPILIDKMSLNPMNAVIPSKSPFWRAYERWRDEGRQTIEGKPIGTRRASHRAYYCQYSDLRKTPDID